MISNHSRQGMNSVVVRHSPLPDFFFGPLVAVGGQVREEDSYQPNQGSFRPVSGPRLLRMASTQKVVVITGWNAGIGLETAKVLAGKGYHVIISKSVDRYFMY